MDLGLEICLIIVAIVFFCVFLRFVIIEWKNRLLLGGYFKQNAELLREAARRQRRAEARRRAMAARTVFVNVPPPAFEDALKMSPVFYIDVEEAAPPTYDDAIKSETPPVSPNTTAHVLNETIECVPVPKDELILSVQNSQSPVSPVANSTREGESTPSVTSSHPHFTTITTNA